MPTVNSDVFVNVEVEFDLCDYEDEIKQEYCSCDCLLDKSSIVHQLKDYVKDMYKTLYLTLDNQRDIKTMEQIYNDLERILNE